MAYAGMPKITLDALNISVAFAPTTSPSALALSLVMIGSSKERKIKHGKQCSTYSPFLGLLRISDNLYG